MVLSKASSSLPDVVFLLFKPCCCLKIGQVTPCQKFGQCCFYPGQSCSNLQEIYDGGVSMIGEGGSSQLNSKQFLGLTTRVGKCGGKVKVGNCSPQLLLPPLPFLLQPPLPSPPPECLSSPEQMHSSIVPFNQSALCKDTGTSNPGTRLPPGSTLTLFLKGFQQLRNPWIL